MTLLCDFGIIALNGSFLISNMEQYMHFLPRVAFMGSYECISLKIFCKWESPAQVYVMLG